MKKLAKHRSVKLTQTKEGQREILREHTNKINEIIDYLGDMGLGALDEQEPACKHIELHTTCCKCGLVDCNWGHNHSKPLQNKCYQTDCNVGGTTAIPHSHCSPEQTGWEERFEGFKPFMHEGTYRNIINEIRILLEEAG